MSTSRRAQAHPCAIRNSNIDFSVLNNLIDVIYAALLGYGFLLISQELVPFISSLSSRSRHFSAVHLILLLFVTNFLYGDYFEARLMNGVVPYNSRKRPVVDSLIPIFFLVAYQAAVQSSPILTLSIAMICILGALWGLFFAVDIKAKRPRIFYVDYPTFVFVSHICLAFAWIVVYFLQRWITHRYNSQIDIAWALAYCVIYITLAAVLTAFRKKYQIPDVEADLLPYWPVALAFRNIPRLRTAFRTFTDIFAKEDA